MEILAVGSRSSEISHNGMSLINKLLTVCTEVGSHTVWCRAGVNTVSQQRDSRSVMLTLHVCSSPQQQQRYVTVCSYTCVCVCWTFFFSCLKWMSLCIAVLSTLLRYHLNTAISCAAVMITAVGNILNFQCIINSLLCPTVQWALYGKQWF